MSLVDGRLPIWIITTAVAFVACDGALQNEDLSRSRLDDDGGAATEGGAASDAGGPSSVVDQSQIGDACGALPDGRIVRCPSSQTCARFQSMDNVPEQPGRSGHCVPRPACSIVTCAAGFTCSAGESFPLSVVCGI